MRTTFSVIRGIAFVICFEASLIFSVLGIQWCLP